MMTKVKGMRLSRACLGQGFNECKHEARFSRGHEERSCLMLHVLYVITVRLIAHTEEYNTRIGSREQDSNSVYRSSVT